MRNLLNRLHGDERGLTGVEYAIMLVFLSIVIAAGAFVLGGDVSTLFNNVGGSLASTTVPKLPQSNSAGGPGVVDTGSAGKQNWASVNVNLLHQYF